MLSRATTMPVVEAGDQMRLEPNQVYVILPKTSRAGLPEEYDLEVIDGMLTPAPRRLMGCSTASPLVGFSLVGRTAAQWGAARGPPPAKASDS